MCELKSTIQESDIWHTIQGSWDIFVGNLQKKYGQLKQESLTEAKGNYQRLAGIIQKEYKVSK